MAGFYWTKDVEEAKKEQLVLVGLTDTRKSDFNPSEFNIGLAIGTSFEENTKTAFAVCAKFNRNGKIISRYTDARVEVDFPYIPGLLAFRVGPAICSAIEGVVDKVDLLLFDGQGIAHPLGFGLASHIGVLFNKPSIGVTKKALFGKYSPPPKGDIFHTTLRHPATKEVIGYCISPGRYFDPFFVSPGHRITLPKSLEVIRMISGTGYLPSPIRIVHTKANKLAREYWNKRKDEVDYSH